MKDCTCQRGAFRLLDYVKVSDTRTNLVCTRCGGLIGTLDEEPLNRNRIMPPKRTWTDEELAELK